MRNILVTNALVYRDVIICLADTSCAVVTSCESSYASLAKVMICVLFRLTVFNVSHTFRGAKEVVSSFTDCALETVFGIVITVWYVS